MNNKIQNIVLGVLTVGLIGITVAYASLSQNLTINGTAKVAAATWDVHFEGMNAGTATGYATIPTTGKLAASGTSVSGNIGTLKAPGDTITYTIEYTSESPKTIAVGNTLTAGASKNITLKIVNSSNATLASEDIAVTASPMIINYVQY